MRYVVWTIRILIFIAVLFFAYQNVTPVDVVLYDGMILTGIPLIVVILLAFVLGAVMGMILMLSSRFKRWRESGRLKRDLARAKDNKSAASASSSNINENASPL